MKQLEIYHPCPFSAVSAHNSLAMPCKICGETGHNRRSCPLSANSLEPAAPFDENAAILSASGKLRVAEELRLPTGNAPIAGSKRPRKPVTCSVCHEIGHNKRSCPKRVAMAQGSLPSTCDDTDSAAHLKRAAESPEIVEVIELSSDSDASPAAKRVKPVSGAEPGQAAGLSTGARAHGSAPTDGKAPPASGSNAQMKPVEDKAVSKHGEKSLKGQLKKIISNKPPNLGQGSKTETRASGAASSRTSGQASSLQKAAGKIRKTYHLSLDDLRRSDDDAAVPRAQEPASTSSASGAGARPRAAARTQPTCSFCSQKGHTRRTCSVKAAKDRACRADNVKAAEKAAKADDMATVTALAAQSDASAMIEYVYRDAAEEIRR